MATHTASAQWQGNLKQGTGAIALPNVKDALPFSFESRFTEDGDGVSPEELVGGALAGCYAMALSHTLSEAGHTVKRTTVSAKVTLEKLEDGFAITRIALTLVADVPGIDEAEFLATANKVKSGCPVSKALKVKELTLDASLVS